MPLVLPDINNTLGEGDHNLFVAGTGTSAPTGIETRFHYNGIMLNDRRMQDAYIVSRIEGLDGPDVRDARESLPSGHGEVPLQAFYGGRTIVLSGRIRAGTLNKLRDMQQALRTAFMLDSIEKPLYFKTASSLTDHFINCRLLSKLQWGEEQRGYDMFNREFQITLRASNPRFFSHRQQSARLYPVGTPDEVSAVELVNEGNFATQPRIRFVGKLEGGEEISVLNETTGVVTQLSDEITEIADNEWYEADSARKTFRNQDGDNAFGNLSIGSDFIEMPPGRNVLSIGTECTGTGYIEIAYRHAWV